MTLLDFSSMTPIRIQVCTARAFTNMRTSPISEVCAWPLDCSELEAVHRSALAPAQLRGLRRVRWAASTASTMPRFWRRRL